jgi:hypothetical protein
MLTACADRGGRAAQAKHDASLKRVEAEPVPA